MQFKGKHDRPLYLTGYIGSTKVNCIQVETGSALSIIPYRLMQSLGICLYRINATQTFIFGFNASDMHPVGGDHALVLDWRPEDGDDLLRHQC